MLHVKRPGSKLGSKLPADLTLTQVWLWTRSMSHGYIMQGGRLAPGTKAGWPEIQGAPYWVTSDPVKMANSSNISLRLNVENGDYVIVKHSGTDVTNCWLYLLMTWGYLIYKTGWVTAQKCGVSICRQYFGMRGVRAWAWPRHGILGLTQGWHSV